jgi:DNA-binding NarL/FixJ family response regulator
VASVTDLQPEIVLLDGSFPAGKAAAALLAAANPRGSVVVFAILETAESVLGWAEAGAKGYLPNTASVETLAIPIGEIVRGEQSCSTRVARDGRRRVPIGRSGRGPALP